MPKNDLSLSVTVPDADEQKVIVDVLKERTYQKGLWTVDFDANNTEANWLSYINHYANGVGKALKYKDDFRVRMIKTAALAIAAVRALDVNAKANVERADRQD